MKCLRLITAIKTPYLPDGRLDLEAYDSLIDMQISSGVEALVVGGTTGEGHLMNSDELTLLISHTVNSFKNKIKVIGNFKDSSTNAAIRAAEYGFTVGMDASLHSNLHYGKTSLQGLATHLKMILSIGPTIIHNIPSQTGHEIPPAMICSLAKNCNMIGVKEWCIGLNRIEDYTARGLALWSGIDGQCHNDRWGCGATGVISIASNLVPRLMHELMFKGENHLLCSKLLPLFEWLFSEPNPIGLNTALAQLGVVKPIFKLPYVPLSMEKRVSFVRIVEGIGRENFVGEEDVQVLEEEDFIILSHY